MSIKKKLGLGIASAALGLSLVGGGTFAYFSDVETTTNTFAAGNVDLVVNPDVIINVDNIKPGDWMDRTFKLENNGSIDIGEIFLKTSYTQSGPRLNGGDFGQHIMVHFLKNEDKSGVLNPSNVITSKTLYELQTMTPDAVKNLSKTIFPFGQPGEKSGIKSKTSDTLNVKFEFVDNNSDNQNQFQEASLTLKWTFDARQAKGEKR